jgi:uncharacterized coiled-coil DUF342 family protein
MSEEERLQYAYPDLVSVEDWLSAKGYTGEAGACHQAMSLIRKQEVRIAELRKEADMMHSEYKTARARIAALEAENEELKKAISKPWMGSARAAMEKKND